MTNKVLGDPKDGEQSHMWHCSSLFFAPGGLALQLVPDLMLLRHKEITDAFLARASCSHQAAAVLWGQTWLIHWSCSDPWKASSAAGEPPVPSEHPPFGGDVRVMRHWASSCCILFTFLQLNKWLIRLTRKIRLRSLSDKPLNTLGDLRNRRIGRLFSSARLITCSLT